MNVKTQTRFLNGQAHRHKLVHTFVLLNGKQLVLEMSSI